MLKLAFLIVSIIDCFCFKPELYGSHEIQVIRRYTQKRKILQKVYFKIVRFVFTIGEEKINLRGRLCKQKVDM